MRRVALLAVVAVLCALVTGCFGRATTAPAATGVQGVVQTYTSDRTGATPSPLAGATVNLAGKTTTTGQDGRFSLQGLAPGAGSLVVDRGDGYPAQEFPVTVTTGKTITVTVGLKNLHQLYALQAGTSQSLPAALSSAKEAGHLASAGCSVCHSVLAPVGPMMLKQATNQLCSNTSCHIAPPFEHAPAHLDPANHPGVRPTGRYASYPELSCLGCHRPHKDSSSWVAEGLLASARMSISANCAECHLTLPSGHPATGGSACTRCHDSNGSVNGHASCSGYSGKYGTPCHRSSSTITTGSHANATKLPGGCSSCHDVSGASGQPKLLKWANNAGLCYQCHTTMSQANLTTGHAKCSLCHDPHSVVTGQVVNPANPAGPLMAVPKENYRGVSRVTNAYCTSCHRVAPPAGYATAKDPYTASAFNNTVILGAYPANFDKNLHRVHVEKVRRDEPPWANRGSSHWEYPFRGNVNNVRCAMCHGVHTTAKGKNLSASVINSTTKFSGGFNGKAGCSVVGGVGSCHSCSYCHGQDGQYYSQNGPGGPGIDCRCSHGDPGYHGIVY